ncbi:unnamed protein product [Urochloa humidicola]
MASGEHLNVIESELLILPLPLGVAICQTLAEGPRATATEGGPAPAFDESHAGRRQDPAPSAADDAPHRQPPKSPQAASR